MKQSVDENRGIQKKRIKRKRTRFADANLEFSVDDPWHVTFQKARLRMGVSQAELGGLIGVTPAAICLWEKGTIFPSPKKFDIIETILNVPLFLRDGRKHKPARIPDYVALIRVFLTLPANERAHVLKLALELSGAGDQQGKD
ncbi:helix-turn-helix domain-containing protein [Acidiphilium sp.]|uniref:helix-turn-helix domain-containing protein n=1 Tax=Acidiphilium sp. TaxID=527 RepID=UPI003D0682FE